MTDVPAAPAPAFDTAARGALRKALLLALLVVVGALVVHASPLENLWKVEAVEDLRTWLDTFGWWAPVVFVIATGLGVTLGAPRLAFATIAGSLFGWGSGIALSFLGTMLGCLTTFAYARGLGRSWVQFRYGARLGRLNDAFARHGFAMNLLLRAAPVGNCHVANLLLAVSPIPPRAFVLGTALGVMPETVVYALFGSSVGGQTSLRLVTGAMMLVALGSVYYLVARRSRHATALMALESESARETTPDSPSDLVSDPVSESSS